MSKFTDLAIVSVSIAILSFVGCGDGAIAPVSGKVTFDGEPVDGIRLVFSPKLTDPNSDPGPWSSAVTSSSGEYTLETRQRQNGAFVGNHIVTFVYDDGDDLVNLQERYNEAKQEGDQAEVSAAKQKVEEYKARQKARPRVPKDHSVDFEVPAGGTAEANFELSAQ